MLKLWDPCSASDTDSYSDTYVFYNAGETSGAPTMMSALTCRSVATRQMLIVS